MNEYKQDIVLREDLDVSTGKLISQACHASLNSSANADEETVDEWMEEGARKIVLQAPNLEELRNDAEKQGVPSALVRDAGETEVEPGTVTALGLGPAGKRKLESITGSLELVE
ncbi:MAG: peptidyl-tRNA hydrolase Pth2 [Candidatus Nanohaloarchaea archaeon]